MSDQGRQVLLSDVKRAAYEAKVREMERAAAAVVYDPAIGAHRWSEVREAVTDE